MGTYKMSFSSMSINGKLLAGDPQWERFNNSFENKELETIDVANEIYTGHAFTTWHKKPRNAANYIIAQHIALDFDTEDERSTLPYLAKDKFIKKFAALAYTTPSHTPDAPRARVLFLLDTPINQAKNYTAAVSALLWLFGTADRQCKDACRFFYGSHNCDLEWIDSVLPLTKIRQIIDQYQATGNIAKDSHTKHRSYMPTAEQKEVQDALDYIKPWSIDYDDWLKILMAIHQGFGDAGLGMAESWADGLDGEVRRKWKSFKVNGNENGTVTLNTVFKMAHDRGWKVL
jgi:hypothetical protein